MNYVTNIPEAYLEYITVRLKDGSDHVLDWDECENDHGPENPQSWYLRTKDVDMEIRNERWVAYRSADGHEDELEGAVIVDGSFDDSYWASEDEHWNFPKDPMFRLEKAVLIAQDGREIELKAGPIELLRENQEGWEEWLLME